MTTAAINAELGPLIERLRPSMRRILKSSGIPPEDAEDVLQEAFLAVLNRWDSIELKEAWLLGTLRRRCAVYWRKRQTSRLEAVDSPALEAFSAPQPAPQERESMVWDLRHLVDTLSERHRLVLWLRYGLGLDDDEVADRLGYSRSSIRQLVGRSLKRLRVAAAPARPAAATPGPPMLPDAAAPSAAAAGTVPPERLPAPLAEELTAQPASRAR
jgi:RNA polymerase sigma factor (sigma-70 family)